MWTDANSKTFVAGAPLAAYRRVRLNVLGQLAYAGAADTDAIGVTVSPAAAGGEVAVWCRSKPGTVQLTAAGAFAAGAAVFAAADGTVDAAGPVLVGEALQGSTGAGDLVEVMLSTTAILGAVARAGLAQEDLRAYPIPVSALRVWDAPSTVLPAVAAADDLGVSAGVFGASNPVVSTGDQKAKNAVALKARFMFAVPPEYVAGQTITLRVNAGMKTTVSDKTATLDAEVVRQAAPALDICATAAKDINNLVAADCDFVITPDNVVPGDVLDVVLTVAVNDAATATDVIGVINDIRVLADIKG